MKLSDQPISRNHAVGEKIRLVAQSMVSEPMSAPAARMHPATHIAQA